MSWEKWIFCYFNKFSNSSREEWTCGRVESDLLFFDGFLLIEMFQGELLDEEWIVYLIYLIIVDYFVLVIKVRSIVYSAVSNSESENGPPRTPSSCYTPRDGYPWGVPSNRSLLRDCSSSISSFEIIQSPCKFSFHSHSMNSINI